MDLVVGLIGALIGAAAVVAAQLLSGRTNLRAAREQQRRVDVATATRSLLTILQAQQWLVWKARNDFSAIGDGDLVDYDRAANKGLAALVGDLGVLSATWPDVYDRYAPLAAAVSSFDNEIALAAVEYRSEHRVGVARMDRMYETVLPFHWYVYKQVQRVVDGLDVQNYDPAAWEGPRPKG